eukprot:8905919-Alexandrium_andersonii.AAC.1
MVGGDCGGDGRWQCDCLVWVSMLKQCEPIYTGSETDNVQQSNTSPDQQNPTEQHSKTRQSNTSPEQQNPTEQH